MMRALVLLLLVSCAAASGYDPKRYEGVEAGAPDPDTQPLPPEPKTTILDPKLPPEPPAPPAPPPAPEPVAEADAGAGDAGATAKAKPKPPGPPPPPTPVAAASDCGSKENPCPMQKLMKTQATSAGSDAAALGALYDKLAGMSPNGGWTWAAISKKGSELAKAGDIPGAKAQCKACHDLYKEAYKKQYRAKKI